MVMRQGLGRLVRRMGIPKENRRIDILDPRILTRSGTQEGIFKSLKLTIDDYQSKRKKTKKRKIA